MIGWPNQQNYMPDTHITSLTNEEVLEEIKAVRRELEGQRWAAS